MALNANELATWQAHCARQGRWYDLRQRAWARHCERRQMAMRMVYPETGGSEHLIHNWYVCRGDKDAAALIAQWWASWRHVSDYLHVRHNRAEHRAHVAMNEVGQYLWCDQCMATDEGKAYWAR